MDFLFEVGFMDKLAEGFENERNIAGIYMSIVNLLLSILFVADEIVSTL